MALTCMLSLAHATARLLVSCTTPPLLAEYDATQSEPNTDVMEPMLIILPPPATFMCGYASREHRNVPSKLIATTCRHSSIV